MEWAIMPKMWINATPCVLMGVGSSSAAYWRPTLAAIFRQNRESTDIVSFAATEQWNAWDERLWRDCGPLDFIWKPVCMCSLDCNSSSAKLKRQVMARVINPQNRRPQRSNSNVSNSPAGSSVEQVREKDTNTELGISLREYTWPSKAIIVKDLESTESTSVTSSSYATYLMH